MIEAADPSMTARALAAVRRTAVAQHAVPSWEIRLLRFAVGVALMVAAIKTLFTVLNTDKPILVANKLEVGMMIGWIVAKSGTIIDWLFGGSESGTRRADAAAQQQAASPSGNTGDPLAVTEEGSRA